MINNNPKVTVIMPVYNSAKYLPAALDSVLAQTLQDFEVVAVNDGSTDDSLAVLERYAARDPRVRFATQKNAGIAAARNAAAALAKGRYIATHDDDDVFHPVRLEKQAAILDARPDLAAVFCRSLVADENLKPIGGMKIPADPRVLRQRLQRGNVLQQSCMVRREVFEKIGGYREALMLSEDFDFNLRLLEAGEILCMPEAYHIYRQHSGQTSVVRKASMPPYNALVRTFAMERRLRGRDSYVEFSKVRDVREFARDYEFRGYFYYWAGRRALWYLLLPDARAYIREAWKGGYRTFGAAWVYAKSLLPPVVLKACTLAYRRLVTRRWSWKIPPYIIEMLSSQNGRQATMDK